jgi:hypothetical protein
MDDFVGTTAQGKPIRVNGKSGAFSGLAIVCEGGYCVGTTVYDNDGGVMREWPRRPVRPQQAFIDALRSGDAGHLRPEILQGHLSTAVCHMGNVSLQCGESMSLARAAASADVRENVHAGAAMERMMKHLAANGVDPRASMVTLGPRLTMDSSSERFVGDGSERANWFIQDSYRAPYVVPERV